MRTKTLPDPLSRLELEGKRRLCYVLDLSGVSNLLVVDGVCRRCGLPAATDGIEIDGQTLPAVVYQRRLRGLLRRRADPRISQNLGAVYSAFAREVAGESEGKPVEDVYLVPVSIFWGRRPDKESSWFKELFSDSWSMVGRLRKFMTILIHGRNTLVQVAKPISLREALGEKLSDEIAVRKISRVIRVHFRRLRVATIGPDLSHRRNLVDELLLDPAVRAEIRHQASANDWPIHKARERARKYGREIAADYSYPVIRFFDHFLSWLWTKLYSGVELNHFELLEEAAPGHEVIYVPCHRSHIDYLLMSYVLYHRGLVPPHVAAGVNLNIPVIGGLLRRAGAFYMRRSFRNNRLYAKVFDAYLRKNLSKGVSLEYFVEGTRSRTGRLLAHKNGMLSMTVQGFLRDQARPVVFVPIYIGYERIIESRSYLSELTGKAKRKETFGGVMRSVHLLRKDFGRVYVNIGRPIFLDALLDARLPDWRERDFSGEGRPDDLKPVINELGSQIMVRINRAAAVNPINLLALALLATPKQAMARTDLVALLDVYLTRLRRAPYSSLVTLPKHSASEIVAHGEKLGVLHRRKHAMGDILALEGNDAIAMTYYRNNILHLFALPSLIACCFVNSKTLRRAELIRLCALAYPYAERELTLSRPKESFGVHVNEVVDTLIELGLLNRGEDEHEVIRPGAITVEATQLSLLAQSTLQTIQRYYLVIALLRKHGSGRIRQSDLEKECRLMAERMLMLHQLDAPEFFDRALFRGFLDELQSRGYLSRDENDLLVFDERIDQAERDAERVLSEQLRHSILQVAHR